MPISNSARRINVLETGHREYPALQGKKKEAEKENIYTPLKRIEHVIFSAPGAILLYFDDRRLLLLGDIHE